MAFTNGKGNPPGRFRAFLRWATFVFLFLLTFEGPAFALDPDLFVIELAPRHEQAVRKVEEIQLADGTRQLRLWTSNEDSRGPYVVNFERLDEAFRVLGTSNPQPKDEWMVSRSWNPQQGGPNRSTLGDTPARANIVLSVAPDRSVEKVGLKMQMNSYGPVYEKNGGRLQVNISYDSKFLKPVPGLAPLRKRVPGKELESYSAVAMRVKLNNRDWILPLEQVEGGGLRVLGTEQVLSHIPTGSLRYLDEQEAKEVVAEHSKRSRDPEFKANQKAVLDELHSYESFYHRPPKTEAPLTFLQWCGRALQSLTGRRPTH